MLTYLYLKYADNLTYTFMGWISFLDFVMVMVVLYGIGRLMFGKEKK